MNLSFALLSAYAGETRADLENSRHISDEDIAADNAYVYIDKELTRASKRAIRWGEKDIIGIFTPPGRRTPAQELFWKAKTDSSIRGVMPKTLACYPAGNGRSPDELKGFPGDEYQDFDLVAHPNGRPRVRIVLFILKEFAKLREDGGEMSKVVFFHSSASSSNTTS